MDFFFNQKFERLSYLNNAAKKRKNKTRVRDYLHMLPKKSI